MLPHIHEAQELLDKCQKLIRGLTILDVPILLSEQYPAGLGPTVESIKTLLPIAQSHDKISFSCCGDDNIISVLAQAERKFIIIAGIEAHVCVLQTVVDLIGLDYQPVVIKDCIGSRQADDKNTAVQRMLQEGAIISTFETILFELCRQAGTDRFSSISRIVK